MVTAEAWGPGADLAIEGVPRLLGLDAPPPTLTPHRLIDELARAAIAGVKEAGHAYLRLDTHRPTMPVAYDLYRRLGFEERRGNPDIDGAVAMVLPLGVHADVS